ncbi:hypothetical protein [Streptomyces hokutonensis]|uniref:hypothetical protein n=1 Tax=Streptomyces hokutonensis TaxID=1306990 RepID=UPI00037F4034|nr:hypothetical protein [Streptomyces hokutonensis]
MSPFSSHGPRGGFALVAAWSVLMAALFATAAPTRAQTPSPTTPRTASVNVPPGVTAGIAVYDRRTGTFTEQSNVHTQFRSASVVKLLIAMDHLWDRGPGYGLPSDDRARLDSMLRSSDDSAADFYWTQDGGSAVIDRMIPRLGLTDTAGPPADYPGYWGYTALSAADTVRIYRWILDSAPAALRDIVMGDLRASTRCGVDGFDQRFGIPASFQQPWAVKQGWSGFGESSDCADTTTSAAGRRVTTAPGAVVDLARPALHTTGTAGAGDRSIVAVFTLHPQGTPFGAAYSALDTLVRSLNIPGAVPRSGSWYGTWGSHVQVRADTTTGSQALTRLPAGVDALIGCQKQGEEVTVGQYTNDWWAYLPLYGGYITNIYIDYPDDRLPDVPVC